MDIKQTASEWRRILVPFLLGLLPMAIAGAVAWGTLTTQAHAMSRDIDRLETRLDLQDQRLQAVEKQNAVVLQRLDYISASQLGIDAKLDRLLSR